MGEGHAEARRVMLRPDGTRAQGALAVLHSLLGKTARLARDAGSFLRSRDGAIFESK